jgi:hypothetical protein
VAEQNPFLHEGDTLTEAFINALPNEEQKEACHALNRRTEFRVLRITYGLFDQIKKDAKKEEEEQKKAAEEQESEQEEQPTVEDDDYFFF